MLSTPPFTTSSPNRNMSESKSTTMKSDTTTEESNGAPLNSPNGRIQYIEGWRLQVLTFSISMSMLLVNMEVSVIATSLVAMIGDLNGFEQMGWVVTGYLVTYTSMIIIWSKLATIFGRKTCMLSTTLLFVAFSGGCGASQTMSQLIINRAFQGIGAAGAVSVGLTIAYEMVPKEKYPIFAAALSASSAVGSLIGPIIGGGFSRIDQWRWVFLINLPVGAIVLGLLAFAIPNHFPYHGTPDYIAPTWKEILSVKSLIRLDITGTFLLLGTSILLVTAMLEGGVSFAWDSASSIVLFVLAGVLGIVFVVNEWWITGDKHRPEPLFPTYFFFNRAWMGVLLTSLLSGVPYNAVVIEIPQRFQITEGISALEAGARLIPYNFLIAFGSVFSNVVAAKSKIAPIYILFAGAVLETLGLGLLCSLPEDSNIPNSVYAYQVLAGLGLGTMFGILYNIPPHVVDPRDVAISSGALLQFRVFGGALGMAISSSILNNHLGSSLDSVLPSEASSLNRVNEIITHIGVLPAGLQEKVIRAFAEGYNQQLYAMTAICAAQFFSIAMLWRKKQISIVEDKKDLQANGEEKLSSS